MSEQSNYENFTNGFSSNPMINPDSDYYYVNSFSSEMSDPNPNIFSYPPSQQTFGYQRQDYYCPPDVGSFDSSNVRMNGSLDTNIPNNGNAGNYFYRVNNYPHPVNYTLPERPDQMPFLSTLSNNAGTMSNTGFVVLVVQVDLDKISAILQ
ncbi:10904_t:CDS:2 [Paraglomus brasilianum]|uniref:10904_t:CDS:1 n=1 Tax=Paraglomus brasilianum TaxID=144538 RepID=A0A9N9FNG4_9GLOM|nr:10904_t:CDS:2 [Paraglomus brasilianum]